MIDDILIRFMAAPLLLKLTIIVLLTQASLRFMEVFTYKTRSERTSAFIACLILILCINGVFSLLH